MDIIAYTMAKRNEKIIDGFKENFMAPAAEFEADGTSASFSKKFDENTLVVMVDGTVVDPADYTADATTGEITFNTAPTSSGGSIRLTLHYKQITPPTS